MKTRKRKTVSKPERKTRPAAKAAKASDARPRVAAVSSLAQGVIDQITALKTSLTRDPGAANVQAADLDALAAKVTELKTSIDALTS